MNERLQQELHRVEHEKKDLQRNLAEAGENSQQDIQQLQDRNLWLETQLEDKEQLIANLKRAEHEMRRNQQQGKSVGK